MKKKVSLGLILLTGLSSQVFAAAGYAKDGLEFSLVLIGFLLLVAGVLKGIDYISKNRKMLVHRVKVFIKKKVTTPPRLHFHSES
ncbi:MAG: hypothetical protein ABSE72_09185 [Bacteroidales bacterium]|jgi:hypothetical protein